MCVGVCMYVCIYTIIAIITIYGIYAYKAMESSYNVIQLYQMDSSGKSIPDYSAIK